jgi:hypothetical protein
MKEEVNKMVVYDRDAKIVIRFIPRRKKYALP